MSPCASVYSVVIVCVASSNTVALGWALASPGSVGVMGPERCSGRVLCTYAPSMSMGSDPYAKAEYTVANQNSTA